MKKWVQKIIAIMFKYTGKEEFKLNAAYKIPAKKVPDMLDKKFLEFNNGQIEACIIHHSTTDDNQITSNWSGIDIYHRSFRMNWVIKVKPLTDLEVKGYISRKKAYLVIKLYNSYYNLRGVEAFYKKVEEITGNKYNIGDYISCYAKNTKIETPWRKIGYNIGIEFVKGKIKVHYGRNLKERGAHCYQDGMNIKGIGFLVVGNFDKYAPSGEIWRASIKIAREIKEVFPNIKFLGHREVPGVVKTCPGSKWNMEQFRKDIGDKNDYL